MRLLTLYSKIIERNFNKKEVSFAAQGLPIMIFICFLNRGLL